jgi:hypothetical protein
MEAFAAQAARMRPGALVLTVSAPLPCGAFRTIAVRALRFSWGLVSVHVQQRQRFGDAWQRRRRLPRPRGVRSAMTADWLLDAPQLLSLRALSLHGHATPATPALLALPPAAVVLLPSCGASPLARQLAALPGIHHVAAFDSVAAVAEAQRAAQQACADALPLSRLAFFAADALDPLCDPPTWRVLRGAPGDGAPGEAPPWEWLNAATFDAVIDQTALDALLPLADGGAVAAGRSLAASCAALKPGGAALLLSALCGPDVALPLLRGEREHAAFAGCAAWAADVAHATLRAPAGSPAAGTRLHAYVCRKAPAASLVVSGARCVAASHAPRWQTHAAQRRCSYAAAGKLMLQQPLFDCLTCGMEAVCAPCARTCHVGHSLARECGSDSDDESDEDDARPLLCDDTIGYCECGFSGVCRATREW